MIENNKTRENINDSNYNNLNISEEEEKEEKDNSDKKKKLKTYKFHILHHNGILNALKKNGINANQIFNQNEDLITDLMKISEQNNKIKSFKKSKSEVFNQNYKNKNNSKKYSNVTNYVCKKYQAKNGNKIFTNKKYLKINSLLHPYYIKGSISFKKMLSRAYINKLKTHVGDIYSTITPNYLAVEPKCIMKVAYKKRKYNFQRPPFKGLSGDYTFDMDKIFFKYNNHIPPKTFAFHKLTGRDYNSEKKLPSFMIGQFNRNSVNTLNEKNLIMNCYSNGQLKQSKSSFNDKKSFNYVLNYQNNKSFNENQNEFENLVKKIMEKGIVNNDDKKYYNNDGNKKENEIVNSIPFRIKSMYKNFMSEYKRDINPRNSIIDGITFKRFNIFNNDRNKFSKGYNNF